MSLGHHTLIHSRLGGLVAVRLDEAVYGTSSCPTYLPRLSSPPFDAYPGLGTRFNSPQYKGVI